MEMRLSFTSCFCCFPPIPAQHACTERAIPMRGIALLAVFAVAALARQAGSSDAPPSAHSLRGPRVVSSHVSLRRTARLDGLLEETRALGAPALTHLMDVAIFRVAFDQPLYLHSHGKRGSGVAANTKRGAGTSASTSTSADAGTGTSLPFPLASLGGTDAFGWPAVHDARLHGTTRLYCQGGRDVYDSHPAQLENAGSRASSSTAAAPLLSASSNYLVPLRSSAPNEYRAALVLARPTQRAGLAQCRLQFLGCDEQTLRRNGICATVTGKAGAAVMRGWSVGAGGSTPSDHERESEGLRRSGGGVTFTEATPPIPASAMEAFDSFLRGLAPTNAQAWSVSVPPRNLNLTVGEATALLRSAHAWGTASLRAATAAVNGRGQQGGAASEQDLENQTQTFGVRSDKDDAPTNAPPTNASGTEMSTFSDDALLNTLYVPWATPLATVPTGGPSNNETAEPPTLFPLRPRTSTQRRRMLGHHDAFPTSVTLPNHAAPSGRRSAVSKSGTSGKLGSGVEGVYTSACTSPCTITYLPFIQPSSIRTFLHVDSPPPPALLIDFPPPPPPTQFRFRQTCRSWNPRSGSTPMPGCSQRRKRRG